ncbi:DUF4238 domain-containing protein [Kitasatospora sp. NPDC057542]|uniref:DUF4238 domain-containing protein n=1 Tax=Kitasatospora sp. NPDC057542 TaxID=3346162 RepID=UPI0036A28082
MNTPSPHGPKAGAEWQARIEAVRAETAHPVMSQHVVSKVLLKRFAVDDGIQGLRVQRFDLDHPHRHHQRRAVKGIGAVRDFVPVASASLEVLWGQVENRLHTAAAAVERGNVFDDARHVEVLKDFIALHWIRSHHYLDVYNRNVTTVRATLKHRLITEYSDALSQETFRRTGRRPAGAAALEAAADELFKRELDDDYNSRADLRVRIEEDFAQAKEIIRSSGLQILRPETGEYLLGDVPAMTIRERGDTIQYGMALGDADAVVLPLGPRHLIVGRSPRDEIATLPTRTVWRLNAVQIKAAHRHVYLRPDSGLEPIVKAYLACGGRSHPARQGPEGDRESGIQSSHCR